MLFCAGKTMALLAKTQLRFEYSLHRFTLIAENMTCCRKFCPPKFCPLKFCRFFQLSIAFGFRYNYLNPWITGHTKKTFSQKTLKISNCRCMQRRYTTFWAVHRRKNFICVNTLHEVFMCKGWVSMQSQRKVMLHSSSQGESWNWSEQEQRCTTSLAGASYLAFFAPKIGRVNFILKPTQVAHGLLCSYI